MAYFKNADELYECFGGLFDKVKVDATMGPKLAASGLIIQFKYSEPDAIITINCKDKPTQEGAYMDVFYGDCDLKPDVLMTMKSEIAHKFWHGKVNLMAALTRKQIVAKGPIPKILKLLPAIKPTYKMYPVVLKELGHEDLIVT